MSNSSDMDEATDKLAKVRIDPAIENSTNTSSGSIQFENVDRGILDDFIQQSPTIRSRISITTNEFSTPTGTVVKAYESPIVIPDSNGTPLTSAYDLLVRKKKANHEKDLHENDSTVVKKLSYETTLPTYYLENVNGSWCDNKKKLGENKYGLDYWSYWRHQDTTNKDSLLVWSKNRFELSAEFTAALRRRQKVNTSNIDEHTLAMTEIREIQSELFNQTIYLPSSAVQWMETKFEINHEICTMISQSDVKNLSEKKAIFHPSRGRSTSFPEIYNGFSLDGRIRIIVVSPDEAVEYAKIHLKQNCAILVLPKSGMGIGYSRFVIQKVAHKVGWDWIWMIDDSASNFLKGEKDKEGKVPNIELSKFLIGMEELIETKEYGALATIGSGKFRGKLSKDRLVEGYASSAFLLNVKETCGREIFFNPEISMAEDICFGILCVASGMTCLRDNLYQHRKRYMKHGGAYDHTIRCLVEKPESQSEDHIVREVTTNSPYNFTVDHVMRLPVAIGSCNQSALGIVPIGINGANFTHGVTTGYVEGKAIISNFSHPQSPTTISYKQVIASSHSGGKWQCRSNMRGSGLLFTDRQEFVKIIQRDGDFTTLNLQNSIKDKSLADAAEINDNEIWIASNATKQKLIERLDLRERPDQTSKVFENKRMSMITQIIKIDEVHGFVLNRSGELRLFDVRKAGNKSIEVGHAIENVLITNSSGIARKPILYTNNGKSLLTYESSAKTRCGVVFSNDFKDCSNMIKFERNQEPSFQVINGNAVVKEVYTSKAKQQNIVSEWSSATQTKQYFSYHYEENDLKVFSCLSGKTCTYANEMLYFH